MLPATGTQLCQRVDEGFEHSGVLWSLRGRGQPHVGGQSVSSDRERAWKPTREVT
jgi:hypothetical protein